MRWSFRIGRIAGIDFKIHVTFLLLLLFVYVAGVRQQGPEAGLRSVLFVCAVFACVIVHEIGHSLIARRFGKEAKSITLLPIGGVATLEEIPEKPGQEILTAIIGPFINLAIAGILYLAAGADISLQAPSLFPDTLQAFVAGLVSTNIMLALFNLVPAFPMDGGRVLRGLLALNMDYPRATSLAVTIGQGFALLFVFYGLFFNFWLAVIGLFLYVGAGSEQQHVMINTVLRRVSAAEIMSTSFHSLHPQEPLSRAIEHVYHGCQNDFPVIGERGLEGILTRADILAAVHERGMDAAVAEVMDRDILRVTPEAPLDAVYRKLVAGRKTAAAVMVNDDLQGLISLDAVSRYFMIQSALHGRKIAEGDLPRSPD